jgi:hypothetical protein
LIQEIGLVFSAGAMELPCHEMMKQQRRRQQRRKDTWYNPCSSRSKHIASLSAQESSSLQMQHNPSSNSRLCTVSAPPDVITTRLQLWPRLSDGRCLFELTCTEVAANCNAQRNFLAIASGFGKKKLKQTLTPGAHHVTPWAPFATDVCAAHMVSQR